jgi:uncharacterized membrane protein YgcG
MRRLLFLLSAVACSAASTSAATRRSVLLSSAALASTCAQPASASKFPQHVEDLDRAVAAGNVQAVQDALRTLGLRADEQAAAVAIQPTGDASQLRPIAISQATKLSSIKLSVGCPDAARTADDFVRYVW